MQISRRDLLSLVPPLLYTYFIPYFSKLGIPPNKKGLALTHGYTQDVEILNANWFYDWDNTLEFQKDPRYVPMSYSGQMIKTDKKDILFLNEPDVSIQSNKSPEEAVILYKALIDKFGVNPIIVGGLTAPWQIYLNNSWILRFLSGCLRDNLPFPKRWHLHGYVEPLAGVGVAEIIEWWKKVHNIVQTDIWITEWGDPIGKIENYIILLDFMEKTDWIVRYAPFGVRLTGKESWYPEYWGSPPKMNLIDENGNLTELGNLYKG